MNYIEKLYLVTFNRVAVTKKDVNLENMKI